MIMRRRWEVVAVLEYHHATKTFDLSHGQFYTRGAAMRYAARMNGLELTLTQGVLSLTTTRLDYVVRRLIH